MDRIIFDARPEKRPRLTLDDGDRGDADEAQQAVYNGLDEQPGTRVGGIVSSALQAPGSGLPPASYFNGAGRVASPPWREDDKDGHFQFDLGENITPRCNHPLLTLVFTIKSSYLR
jgi:dual-specificity kinase